MNNTDKLLSDIANDVVVSFLRNGVSQDSLKSLIEEHRTFDLNKDEFWSVLDKADDALKELAAFFERTIK